MKAVILAGGIGSRITEETHLKPKPMVEIGAISMTRSKKSPEAELRGLACNRFETTAYPAFFML